MAEPGALMERYCDGDASAFRELYALVAPRLLGYLLKMARQKAIADDLLQQTFFKVHRARSAYIRGVDPLPWIYAIAHRVFLDHARATKRAIVGVSNHEGGTLPERAAGITGEAVDRQDEPADPERLAAAMAALAQLPIQQREAVVLVKLEGKTVAEAATIAGTSVG
ncbi:MAG: RNA polymerase sigma factor, partial [Proteobacteria bacterium]|nr:RNA polymerase sigma factor [Pseudomonadota bacterium]